MQTPASRTTIREWLPLIALTFSAFIFNTSEFIPIGLLSDIAADFSISEAKAGMLISIYAWFVALLSLPLMLLASKMEYRKLLLWTVFLFAACQILSALAPGYYVLMASRIGVACTHAIFWSIASPLAVRIAPKGKITTALGMIVTGTSIAMIAGLPLGRIIGLYLSWRITFVCIAVAAFLVFLLLTIIFPKVPNANPFPLAELPSLLENRTLLGIYLFTALTTTAHYTGYSYIEPFLGQVAGLGENWITFVLVTFGISGIFGSFLFSRYFGKFPRLFIPVTSAGLAVFMLLLRVSAYHLYTVILLCFLWGIAITEFSLVFQAEIIRFAPRATTIAMSIFSGIFNLGIGTGTLAGGGVCTWLSIPYIGYAGGAIAIIAFIYCIAKLLPLLKAEP
ncbi:sugar transporter [Oxalobacter aliiformigenes]|uniref:Sugar transporter n=1 Tax=Oxalobacter aliiformigenes TaxID=2946593 RepID=A0A9E9NSJ2_9BURK|nr:sugar transporter [Oxalobacter aliiformigenes]WAV90718.1 sugar transporter [Oxalobacter aliiformigenes]